MSETPIARKILERVRRQLRSEVANLAAFREGNAYAEALQHTVAAPETLKTMHPVHAKLSKGCFIRRFFKSSLI